MIVYKENHLLRFSLLFICFVKEISSQRFASRAKHLLDPRYYLSFQSLIMKQCFNRELITSDLRQSSWCHVGTISFRKISCVHVLRVGVGLKHLPVLKPSLIHANHQITKQFYIQKHFFGWICLQQWMFRKHFLYQHFVVLAKAGFVSQSCHLK